MLPVIVFGAALEPDGTPRPVLRARLDAALRFGRERADTVYLLTGGVPCAGRTEAAVMADILREQGVPKDALLLEARSRDTCESTIACTRLLWKKGYAGPVVLVTSDFHMMRCTAMMRALGWKTQAVPAPACLGRSRSWRAWVWLREFPAMLWDVFLVARWRLCQRGV
ncbi:YdcF family protein [Acetobacter estunensis]|uniref:YdcF family protein n=1 Tax=Acetobacter estunensis TaxID=104097 RepID=UPI001C2CF55D|nr:YdcF family protein [Acetobacter estunensis]MBV1835760.1 YdcF family protein [Acetobacter estunensis]MBV1835979.1 YdcF family protein [Acetobacter estunensis]